MEMDRFRTKESREKLARAVRAAWGEEGPVVFENGEPLEAKKGPGKRGPRASEGMKRLQERFGGEVVPPPPKQSGLFEDQEGPGTGREEGS